MLKELLKSLYKAKPELVEEHKRLVETLRSGSKAEQLKEADRQLKELKEMVGKADRCWEGYEPVPGKKPYEKGSCAPVKKDDGKQESTSKRSWKIKIKNKPGYHEVKDVLDMGSQQHNSYVLHDGTTVPHGDVEDLDISGKASSLVKSNYGPKGMGLYNQADNIKRKETRTGEVHEDIGQNKAVRQYTSAAHGTATQQASRQAAADKLKSAKNPVKSMKDMSDEELQAIKDRYAAKSELDDKIASIKSKHLPPKEKSIKDKIKDIKDKYSDKLEPSDEEKISDIKDKYSKMLKSKEHVQNLIKQISVRQPTDAELEVLLEYNSKIAQELSNPIGSVKEEEAPGY